MQSLGRRLAVEIRVGMSRKSELCVTLSHRLWNVTRKNESAQVIRFWNVPQEECVRKYDGARQVGKAEREPTKLFRRLVSSSSTLYVLIAGGVGVARFLWWNQLLFLIERVDYEPLSGYLNLVHVRRNRGLPHHYVIWSSSSLPHLLFHDLYNCQLISASTTNGKEKWSKWMKETHNETRIAAFRVQRRPCVSGIAARALFRLESREILKTAHQENQKKNLFWLKFDLACLLIK
jgi:hypothetical protein